MQSTVARLPFYLSHIPRLRSLRRWILRARIDSLYDRKVQILDRRLRQRPALVPDVWRLRVYQFKSRLGGCGMRRCVG